MLILLLLINSLTGSARGATVSGSSSASSFSSSSTTAATGAAISTSSSIPLALMLSVTPSMTLSLSSELNATVLSNMTSFTPTQSVLPTLVPNEGSPFLANRVVNSRAFIPRSAFYKSYLAAQPYLPHPMNGTDLRFFSNYSYPDFLNSAVLIGRVKSVPELAMYWAQLLYQSDGLRQPVDPICANSTSQQCLEMGLSATVDGTSANYFGRGYLWLTGASSYTAATNNLFGNATTLLTSPDSVRDIEEINYAASAWKWRNFVRKSTGGLSTFGATTQALRPFDCTKDPLNQSPNAVTAYNVYVAVLKALSPSSIPLVGLC